MVGPEDGHQPLPTVQRNSGRPGGSALEQMGFIQEVEQPHPGELLFQIENLKDLVMKSDIPENMVSIIARMLWKAERYSVPALTSLVEWFLVCRLPVNRQARLEYMEIVVGKKKQDEEAEALNKLA